MESCLASGCCEYCRQLLLPGDDALNAAHINKCQAEHERKQVSLVQNINGGSNNTISQGSNNNFYTGPQNVTVVVVADSSESSASFALDFVSVCHFLIWLFY